MNLEDLFDTRVENAIREYMILVKQSSSEERIQIAEFHRMEADKQEKDIIKFVLIKLAEYAETMEESK